MSMGRDDALLILRKWRDERALLRCDVAFDRFIGCFRARVDIAEPDRVHFLSDDATSELDLRFRPDVTFAYAEPRDFPEDAAAFVSGLAVFFPEGGKWCFLEFIQPE